MGVQCSAQCLLPGNIHIDAVCPDKTQLLFHYNNIQSPQCAGWRCGTMPPLTEPDRDKSTKIRCSAHMHPEKTTRISFPNKQKKLHPYHRNTAASLHKLFSAMILDCCRLKSGYHADTTLRTAASRRTQSSSRILERQRSTRLLSRPRSLHRPPQWSPVLFPILYLMYGYDRYLLPSRHLSPGGAAAGELSGCDACSCASSVFSVLSGVHAGAVGANSFFISASLCSS